MTVSIGMHLPIQLVYSNSRSITSIVLGGGSSTIYYVL